MVDATEHPRGFGRGLLAAPGRRPAGAVPLSAAAGALRRGDLLIRPDVDGFTSLNFSHGQHRAAPRRAASSAADSILPRLGCPVADRVPRRRTLPTRIARVTHGRRQRAPSGWPSRRLLGLGRADGDTLDYSLVLQRVARSRQQLRGLRVRVAHAERHGRFGRARSGPPPRRPPRRGARPRLRQRAGRADVGRRRGSPISRSARSRGVPRVFLGELRRELCARISSPLSDRTAAPQSRRSLYGWPTRTSGASTATETRSGKRSFAKARLFAGIERTARARDWELAIGAEGRAWDEPGRANRSTARRRGSRHRRQPAARASAPGRGRMDRDVPAGGARGHGSAAARRRAACAAGAARLG